MGQSEGQTPENRLTIRALQVVSVCIACLVSFLFVRYLLGTAFSVADDEGYVLLSLSHYRAGGHLYSEVFSQYGPFFFFAEDSLLRLLHLPITHDGGRVATLILWLASGVFGGACIYRMTRGTSFALAAGLAIVFLGRVLANEPGHPQQFILPMLLLACCLSVSPGWLGFFLLGAVGAGLAFIKINVAVFYFAAVGFALVGALPAGRLRKIGTLFLLIYAAAFPLVLVRRDLFGWAVSYAAIMIVCGVSTFLVGLRVTSSLSSAPLKDRRGIRWVAIGAVAVGAAIIVAALLHGISGDMLLEGVIRGPLRHPGVFEIPLNVTKKMVLYAALGSACVVGFYYFRDRGGAYTYGIDAVRMMAGAVVIYLLVHLQNIALLTLLPISLIQAGSARWKPSEYFARLFVTGLAATQLLQIYPVAGSQICIAISPAALWAVLCIADGTRGLHHLMPKAKDRIMRTLVTALVPGGLLALLLLFVMLRHVARWRTDRTPASALYGSESLHLPIEQEANFEFLAANLRANCDILFTLPGMGSLNFWSQVPTPNGMNLTAWMKGFNPQTQDQILQKLEQDPKACAVFNPDIAADWGPPPNDLLKLPLARYVIVDMPKISQAGEYEIHVSPHRNIPWLAIGKYSPSKPGTRAKGSS